MILYFSFSRSLARIVIISLYIFSLITWTSLQSISLVYHARGWVMTIFYDYKMSASEENSVQKEKNLIKIFLRIVNKIVTRRHATTRWNKENDNKALFTLERCPQSSKGVLFHWYTLKLLAILFLNLKNIPNLLN